MMRLSSDIRCIAGNTNNLLTTIVSNLIVIVGAGLYLFYLDFTIIIVAIIITPMVLIASRIFMGKIYLAQRKIKELESEIASYNKETFNNIQAVKAFNLGDTFYEKMEKLEEKRIEADLRSNKYSLASWTVSFAAGLLAGGICVCWLFYRVHTGVISFGSLSVMTFLAIQVGGKLKGFMNMVPSVMEFVTSAERVKKLLKLKDEDSNEILEESSVIIEKSRGMGASVCIEDMSFNYKNGYKVFEKASMKANPGEIVALVGPSGGGKTTLLRLILGIVSKSTGRIYSKIGKELLDFGKNTRAMISYVPQGNTMMAGTIKENMKLIKPDASDEEIEEALKTACIYDFVSGLPDGIEHRLGENALGFSEGQNQRLSIARALLKDAPILLLDEATSALDVVTERKILDNVIRKNPKKTVILTTHRPTVLTMCDRVYHIGSKKLCRLGERGIKELMDEF